MVGGGGFAPWVSLYGIGFRMGSSNGWYGGMAGTFITDNDEDDENDDCVDHGVQIFKNND